MGFFKILKATFIKIVAYQRRTQAYFQKFLNDFPPIDFKVGSYLSDLLLQVLDTLALTFTKSFWEPF